MLFWDVRSSSHRRRPKKCVGVRPAAAHAGMHTQCWAMRSRRRRCACIRVRRRQAARAPGRDTEESEWRPTFALALRARLGGALPAVRLSFAAKGPAAQSAVAVSSREGELVWADYALQKARQATW